MADPADMLLSPHDQLWLVLALGAVVLGGAMVGAASVGLSRRWAARNHRRALRRAGR